MPWRVRWDKRALKEAKHLSVVDRDRIARFLNERVAPLDNPRDLGEALAGPWSGYWKYRVGDYRVIASIEDQIITITIVKVGNRREVYR